ncbi:MAG: SRPBCC family protein [Opitutaceae bacterium]|nr:SRPBCC family protein [Cytophagales bacterium]
MITITEHSGIYTLECQQTIPWSIEKAWDFFSSPLNLAKITPPKMGFEVTSKNLDKVYPGQIISYQVGILPFIKTNWVTEITYVRSPKYFVDEQRIGPYSMWHHEHIFEETAKGLLMTDRVSYQIPFGIIGRFLTGGMIKNQLLEVFNYRILILNNLTQPV